MSRATGSYQDLLGYAADLLSRRQTTLWVGEELSSATVPSGRRLVRRIARVSHYALFPYLPELPPVNQIAAALEGLGVELAQSLADRTIGRTLPLSLEDPFDGRHSRLPEWEHLLQCSVRGEPGYVHRAIVALAHAGLIPRIVTACQDELLEKAAVQSGRPLRVFDALEADIPGAEEAAYLFKFHGTGSRPGSWPMDLHRLHLARQSGAMRSFHTLLESHPLIVMGYLGPDPLDLGPVLTRSRLRELLWVDAVPCTFEAEHFGSIGSNEVLFGDLADRLLMVHGGWRLRGRLPLFLEDLCDKLGIEVPGLGWDEEITAVRELDDLWWPEGEEPPLHYMLQPLGDALRARWVGAFALLTYLDLWSESALEAVSARRQRLEQDLSDNRQRGWFRYLLTQTARPQVEAALSRHFRGVAVPPTEDASLRRLEMALLATDTMGEELASGPLTSEELNVERIELRFALTGEGVFLPSAAQAIAELPSTTHAERWLRLKAAGALSRRQWSVAIHELSRALAEGGESGSPLMKLRARVGLAGILAQLLGLQDPAPLVGCLKALKRRDRGLAGLEIDQENCRLLVAAMALRLFDETLEGYAVFLPTLQPPLSPLVDTYVRLATAAYGSDARAYLFDRHSERGRSYSYLPGIERVLADKLAESFRREHPRPKRSSMQSP